MGRAEAPEWAGPYSVSIVTIIILVNCRKMATTTTGKQQEKEPLNIVHQNAIFRETVAKEQRHQKLYTSFKFNPYKDREFYNNSMCYIIIWA